MVTAHQRDEESEHPGLHQRRDDVIHLKIPLRGGEILRAVEAQPLRRQQPAAHHTQRVRHQHQERHHQHGGENARGNQPAERIGAQRHQRVDLLRHPHRAQFGRHGAGDTAGHHQPAQHRAKFTHHTDHGDGRHCRGRVEAAATDEDLLRQRGTRENRGEANHRQGQPADHQHLLRQLGWIPRRLQQPAERGDGKARQPADARQRRQHRRADGDQRGDHAHTRSKRWPSATSSS